MHPPSPPHTGRGVIALVLGILSVLTCGCVTGIPAWLLGNAVQKDVPTGHVTPSELSFAQAGKVLGIVGTAIWVLSWSLIGGYMLYLETERQQRYEKEPAGWSATAETQKTRQ